jgi:hypothetical protein
VIFDDDAEYISSEDEDYVPTSSLPSRQVQVSSLNPPPNISIVLKCNKKSSNLINNIELLLIFQVQPIFICINMYAKHRYGVHELTVRFLFS